MVIKVKDFIPSKETLSFCVVCGEKIRDNEKRLYGEYFTRYVDSFGTMHKSCYYFSRINNVFMKIYFILKYKNDV
jgi:hypothetical protein